MSATPDKSRTLILVSGSTATVRRLSPKYPGRLGHLLTPNTGNSVPSTVISGLPWAVDNGAFSGFDDMAFRKLLARVAGAQRLKFVVCPDVVGDAGKTLDLFFQWHPILHMLRVPIAFVAQDGSEDYDLPWLWFHALFIGGSTKWKLSQAASDVAAVAKNHNRWLHVGRVNTLRRLRFAHDLGADSIDGTCFSRWGNRYLEWGLKYLASLDEQPLLENVT